MPEPALSTTTLATPVCAPLWLVPIPWVDTPEDVADLSSTGTSSSFTPEAQLAKRPTKTILDQNFFDMINLVNLKVKIQKSWAHWAPVGFPNITTLTRQARFDSAVQRGGHQGFTALDNRRVDQKSTVGRKTGALIGRCVGQRSDLP
jgi:hypothetical protein